jgi:hypothetical protein
MVATCVAPPDSRGSYPGHMVAAVETSHPRRCAFGAVKVERGLDGPQPASPSCSSTAADRQDPYPACTRVGGKPGRVFPQAVSRCLTAWGFGVLRVTDKQHLSPGVVSRDVGKRAIGKPLA